MKAIFLTLAFLLYFPVANAGGYMAPFPAEHSIDVLSSDGETVTTYRIKQVVPPRQHGLLSANRTEFTLVVEPNEMGLRTLQITVGYIDPRSNLTKAFALEQVLRNSTEPVKITVSEDDVSVQDDNKKLSIVSAPGKRDFTYIISGSDLLITTQNRDFSSLAEFAEAFPVQSSPELLYIDLREERRKLLHFLP